MADYLEAHPAVGACGPCQKDRAGVPYPPPMLPSVKYSLAKLFFLRRFFRPRAMTPGPQKLLDGACLMLPRAVREQMPYFDERYRFYFEDVDLCARLVAAGYELHIVPGVMITHVQRGSSRRVSRSERMGWCTDGLCRYLRTHCTPARANAIMVLELLGVARKLVPMGLAAILTLGLAPGIRGRVATMRVIGRALLRGLFAR